MTESKQTIWKLVYLCAQDLTNNGISPFTRGDIIACIKRKTNRYDVDSINPIIQGITDNLRGGAPGAVGKNILHSVGRGLFILKGKGIEQLESSTNVTDKFNKQLNIKDPNHGLDKIINTINVSDNDVIDIGKYSFHLITAIDPEREANSSIREFMPQDRYENVNNLPLNKYGNGPYCKFKIPRNITVSGVYALTVEGTVKYIGECEKLSQRYNMGYGNISPRNCFVGGQETNCRINNLILHEINKRGKLLLWFYETENYKAVELELRRSLTPCWNRV